MALSSTLPRFVGSTLWLCGALLAQGSAPTAPAVSTALDHAAAAEHSAANEGLAVLVYDHGELVFEEYQNGYRAETPQHLFSGTKSFVSVVALVAEAEGLLTLDERCADTLTEWQGDEKREQIKVHHLLDFTSGLENADGELHTARCRDKYARAVACECEFEPGKRFRYGSNHGMAFGELFQRKLDAARANDDTVPVDFVDYLEQRVLDPIDCEVGGWIRDGVSNPVMSYGAMLTAREWAKFGLLLLARGKHGEEQIVPDAHFDQLFEGTKANPRYGLNFWLHGPTFHRRNAAVPDDVVAAAGMYDQRLFLVPSRELVIVRFGRNFAPSSDYGDFEFLEALFGGKESDAAKGTERGKLPE